uniref:Secreted protein n=1 Tax=Ascaris lumbricoides TaxID=6252 RepID=A0A0M3HHZ0_ASCLU
MRFPRKWYITLYIFNYILDDFSLNYLILSKFIMNLNTLLGCSYANATGPSAAAAELHVCKCFMEKRRPAMIFIPHRMVAHRYQQLFQRQCRILESFVLFVTIKHPAFIME